MFSVHCYGMVHSGICIDLANRYRLDSVLCINQCTLQYCFTFEQRTQDIFSVHCYEMVYSGIYMNFARRYRLDSVNQCTLQYCFIFEQYTQDIFSVG